MSWNPLTPRRRRDRVERPLESVVVNERVEQLNRALDLAGPTFPAEETERTRRLLTKARQRTGLGAGHTIVALAGATGSGKSSLFNALVGTEVAQVGVTRPTTSRAGAATWGRTPHELLDWISVAGRHEVSPSAPGFEELEGLVLLDLPDIDSRVAANRAEADRVLELCDVFVWVTDPQKYADALLHEEYVGKFAQTRATSLVVLNQIDRLPPDAAQRCLTDLARLLADDGLADARVLPASTVARNGGDQVLDALADIVQAKNSADRRLIGDLTVEARKLSAFVGAPRAGREPHADGELVGALEQAAAVPVVLDAVERNYLREATAHTGWPVTRWVHKAKPKPLTRLGLDRVTERVESRSEKRVALGRSSLPPATASARAAVDLATRRLGDRAADGMPPAWADEIHDALTPDDARIADQLDQAVLATPLEGKTPGWWAGVSALQWVLAAVACVGMVWLLALAGLASVQVHLAAPTLGSWLPIPLLLALAGLGCGALLAVLARSLAERGARRSRAQAQERLTASIEGVATTQIVEPVAAIVARHDACAEALARAAV